MSFDLGGRSWERCLLSSLPALALLSLRPGYCINSFILWLFTKVAWAWGSTSKEIVLQIFKLNGRNDHVRLLPEPSPPLTQGWKAKRKRE